MPRFAITTIEHAKVQCTYYIDAATEAEARARIEVDDQPSPIDQEIVDYEGDETITSVAVLPDPRQSKLHL